MITVHTLKPGVKWSPLLTPVTDTLTQYMMMTFSVDYIFPKRPSFSTSQKFKFRHFEEIFVTGSIGGCHFGKSRCSQWLKLSSKKHLHVSDFTVITLEIFIFFIYNFELICSRFYPHGADTLTYIAHALFLGHLLQQARSVFWATLKQSRLLV